MSLTTRFFRKFTQRIWTKLMDRVGGRLVSGMADTSADTPSAFHKPKRDVYRKMQAAEAGESVEDDDHDHSHDHD